MASRRHEKQAIHLELTTAPSAAVNHPSHPADPLSGHYRLSPIATAAFTHTATRRRRPTWGIRLALRGRGSRKLCSTGQSLSIPSGRTSS
jgi:hypothetical protein